MTRPLTTALSLVAATLLALRPSGASADGLRAEAAPLDGTTAVRLDGHPDEEAWNRAVPITDFVQRQPSEGERPSHQTEVRVLYDNAHLYVAVVALDTDPSRIVGIRTRRDEPSPSDWLRVFVDSYHDHRTAYEFAVNPAGVKQDRYWFNDASSDTSWDAVWDVVVVRDARGWRAEFRVPLSQLRYAPGSQRTFGFAVVREIGRLNETSSWPLLARSRPGYVSQFGELSGLQLTGASRRLELVPYTVAEVETQPVAPRDPFAASPNPGVAAGADLKYAVTPGLTLTSTINPDFGQVEADPAVVNLTSFETFYEERRPFFVEGSGALTFDLDCNDGRCTGLFYSRRIGRVPQGAADAPPGGYASAPLQTTIIGAGKLTGRAGPFSIGMMNAVTAEERADVASDGERWTQTVEPLTSYTVAQARREWPNQSSLAFMATSTDRRLDADTGFLAAHALTGGASWDWRMRDPRYAFTGYWAGSAVRGSQEAMTRLQESAVHLFQRADAGHVDVDPSRTSLLGQAGTVSLNKVGGQRVRFSFVGGYKSPGFEANDVGYHRRADEIFQSSWVQLRWERPTAWYRSWRVNVNQWGGWNFAGDSRYTGVNVNAHVVLQSNWGLGGGATAEARGIDDRAARGGPGFLTKRGANAWCYVQTDTRHPVSGIWQGYVYRDESGSSQWGLDPSVTWRPAGFLSFSLGASLERRDEDTQWVQNVDDASGTHYVFGRLQQTTASFTARLNYTITPTLTIQAYLAPFVSAGDYGEFKELVRPRVLPVQDQFAPYEHDDQHDFSYRSFRMTNVLRWEYRPGSTLFVVWQQRRESNVDDGRFRFGYDVGSLFDAPARNVFLIKLSYWFNV